jgi:hypothetical protein
MLLFDVQGNEELSSLALKGRSLRSFQHTFIQPHIQFYALRPCEAKDTCTTEDIRATGAQCKPTRPSILIRIYTDIYIYIYICYIIYIYILHPPYHTALTIAHCELEVGRTQPRGRCGQIHGHRERVSVAGQGDDIGHRWESLRDNADEV